MGWIADLLKEIPSAARYKAELEEMGRENGILKEKVSALELDNKKLRQEIRRRDDIIQKDKSHNDLLEEDKIKILTFLSNQQDRLTAQEISRSLGMNIQIVKFHLEELEKSRMVNGAIYSGAPRDWLLVQEGRRYLIENKLLT